ncbi:hypothetical protein ACFX16_000450 [Malus domestica]
MESHFGASWKKLGVFDAIKLSTIEISIDQELLIATLSFWCPTINTMVLHLNPIRPTVLDVKAILGTSPSSLSIDTAIFRYQFDLDLKKVFEEHAYEVLKKKDQEVLKY